MRTLPSQSINTPLATELRLLQSGSLIRLGPLPARNTHNISSPGSNRLKRYSSIFTWMRVGGFLHCSLAVVIIAISAATRKDTTSRNTPVFPVPSVCAVRLSKLGMTSKRCLAKAHTTVSWSHHNTPGTKSTRLIHQRERVTHRGVGSSHANRMQIEMKAQGFNRRPGERILE